MNTACFTGSGRLLIRIKSPSIQKPMADQKLVIADGHHRYETSLNFRNENRSRAAKLIPDAPYEFSMMTFINTRAEGLTILPTHRVVANVREFSWSAVRRYLEPWFVTEVFPFEGPAPRHEVAKKFLHQLSTAGSHRSIGVYPAPEASHRAFYLLTLRPGSRPGANPPRRVSSAARTGRRSSPSRHPRTRSRDHSPRCRFRSEPHVRA